MIASPFTHLIGGPDYGAFPVWDRSPRHLGGMVRAKSLGRELTAELQRELGPDVVVAFYSDEIDAPPLARAGCIEDHRVEAAEIGRASGFDLR